MRLHKYVSPSTARRVLGTSKLRSSTLASFNDPFEGQVITLHGDLDHGQVADEFCRQVEEMAEAGEKVPLPAEDEVDRESPIAILISLYQHGHLGEMSAEDFNRVLREYIGRLKFNDEPSAYVQRVHSRLADYVHVICLSANENSLLMWAHYADHHRGALLSFETERASSPLSRAEPVRYSRSFPKHNGLSRTVSSHLKRPIDGKEWMNNTLMTKSEEWAYEEEYRVLVGVTERDDDALVQVPPECLVSMVLGCRMSEAEASELSAMAGDRFPNIAVARAKRDPSNFRLNYLPYARK